MIVCPYADLSRYTAVIPGLEEAMEAISAMTQWTPGVTPLSGGNRLIAQEYTTADAQGKLCEAHRQFLDVQYIVEGEEYVGWAPLNTLTPADEFDTEKDIGRYAGPVDYMRVGAGYCYVVFPEDAHSPSLHMGTPVNARKIVMKLKV